MAPTTRATPTRSSKARCRWKTTRDATFDAKGKSDDEAKKIIGDIFLAGLKSIKQKAMPPEETPAQ